MPRGGECIPQRKPAPRVAAGRRRARERYPAGLRPAACYPAPVVAPTAPGGAGAALGRWWGGAGAGEHAARRGRNAAPLAPRHHSDPPRHPLQSRHHPLSSSHDPLRSQRHSLRSQRHPLRSRRHPLPSRRADLSAHRADLRARHDSLQWRREFRRPQESGVDAQRPRRRNIGPGWRAASVFSRAVAVFPDQLQTPVLPLIAPRDRRSR